MQEMYWHITVVLKYGGEEWRGARGQWGGEEEEEGGGRWERGQVGLCHEAE